MRRVRSKDRRTIALADVMGAANRVPLTRLRQLHRAMAMMMASGDSDSVRPSIHGLRIADDELNDADPAAVGIAWGAPPNWANA